MIHNNENATSKTDIHNHNNSFPIHHYHSQNTQRTRTQN